MILEPSGGCWKATSLAFREFEFVEVEPVPAELYTTVCRGCWPSSAPAPLEGAGSDDEAWSGSCDSTHS